MRYSIWRDEDLDVYEIVRWDGRRPTIVQTNIQTREKAEASLVAWQQRATITPGTDTDAK